MRSFLYISYDSKSATLINTIGIERFLQKRSYNFNKIEDAGKFKENTLCYQIYDHHHDEDYSTYNHILISGNSRGLIHTSNYIDLSAIEIKKIINENKNEEIELEGTLAYLMELKDSIVFQNDIEGYRKIFYYINSDVVCVSNFMPLIITAINRKWKLKMESVSRFILSRESMWPSTMIEEIKVLPPKSRAEFKDNKLEINSSTYSKLYSLKKLEIEDVKKQLVRYYTETVTEAIRKKRVGVTLSGGYDSTNLLKFSSELNRDAIKAISIGFASNRFKDLNVYDETVFAKKSASYYDVSLISSIVTKEKFFNNLELMISLIDQPGLDPSSFHIMSVIAKEEGLNCLISAMGGDALFSSKRTGKMAIKYFNLVKYIPNTIVSEFANKMNNRGPMKLFRNIYRNGSRTNSYFVAMDRSRLSEFGRGYFKEGIDDEMESYRLQQLSYWTKIFEESNSNMDILYSFAALANPDEYHAYTIAERNGIEMVQPFVKINSVIEVLNASKFYPKINSRDFECELFGGINRDLLFKGKSGFSIPYSEWCHHLADETLHFWFNHREFNSVFDLQRFSFDYYNDESKRTNHSFNMMIWKLNVLMRYVKLYNIK